MLPPPDALGRVESASATAERRRATRRARRANRRAYYGQCVKCSASGTFRDNGAATGQGLPVDRDPTRSHLWRHRECGGAVLLYDIAEGDR